MYTPNIEGYILIISLFILALRPKPLSGMNNIHSINQLSVSNNQTSFNASDFWLQNILAAPNCYQPAFQPASYTSNVQATSNVDKQQVMELSDNTLVVSVIDPKEDSQIKKKNVKPSARRKSPSSHSTAEKARREKINHKFRCLQELIPGCYKAMGMSAMLEEIINYVQSLQNQVEYLSMELAAASSSHGLNIEKDAIQNMQGTNTRDMREIESMVSQGYAEHHFFC